MDGAQNYTYMLRCRDGSFYIGWTNELDARVAAHNAGRGGKYTRSRRPVELVYFECFPTKREAMSREWHLKRLSHAQKAELLEEKDGANHDGARQRRPRDGRTDQGHI